MADVTTRLAVQLSGGTSSTSTPSTFMNCIVSSVVTGGAVGGADAVYITVGTDNVPAPYLGAAPPAGAMVRVEFAGGSPLIHGRVLGLPSI